MTTKPKPAISRRSPAYVVGLVGSFATYLLPVFGRHFTHRPWGPLLLEEIDRYPGGPAAGWFAGNLALALVLQVVAALLLYWLVRRPNWPAFMALVASVPVFVVTLNVAHGGRFPPPLSHRSRECPGTSRLGSRMYAVRLQSLACGAAPEHVARKSGTGLASPAGRG